jgi:hypothetical protein
MPDGIEGESDAGIAARDAGIRPSGGKITHLSGVATMMTERIKRRGSVAIFEQMWRSSEAEIVRLEKKIEQLRVALTDCVNGHDGWRDNARRLLDDL